MERQNEKNRKKKSIPEREFKLRHLVGRAALSIALGLLLAFIVPSRFTEEMGAQTIARYAAPFSGYWFDGARQKEDPNQRENKHITVLVIDYESLVGRGDGWPARYEYHSWLVKFLEKHRPKAVFLDVILSQPLERDQGGGAQDRPNEFDAFKKRLLKLMEDHPKETPEKTRVFLAARLTEKNTLETNEKLDKDPSLNDATRVGVEFAAHAVDRLSWTYPLVYPKKEDCDEQVVGHARYLDCVAEKKDHIAEEGCKPSAAFAIYNDVYNNGAQVSCEEAGFMSVTWPLDTASNGLLWRDPDDEESEQRRHSLLRVDAGDGDEQMYCTSSDSELALLWRAEWRAFLRPTSRPLCVHYETIHASQLEQLEKSPDNPLDVAFKDNIVMIGTSFAYSNDFVLSPLQDRIPGVFLHAVALDNLLAPHRSIDEIEAWEPELTMPWDRWKRLLLMGTGGFVAILLIAAGKKFARERFQRFYAERRHWRSRFSWHWWAAKGMTAGFNIVLWAVSGLLLIALGVGMVVWGTHVHVPFLVIAHVIACTIAVEWLEWSEHLYKWITDSKEE